MHPAATTLRTVTRSRANQHTRASRDGGETGWKGGARDRERDGARVCLRNRDATRRDVRT